ncbi:Hint domain-containing protein [Kribbella sp. NPDC051620]|uniref:Hint domain-containing protein n=1 Tax=Kribbella sp. NPDC051620 TaxID=3364120 RepID=UPI0037BBE555
MRTQEEDRSGADRIDDGAQNDDHNPPGTPDCAAGNPALCPRNPNKPATTVGAGDDQTGDNGAGADLTYQDALDQTGSVIGTISDGGRNDLFSAMANDPARPHPDRFYEMAGCIPGPSCVMPEGWQGEYGDYLPLPGEELFGEGLLLLIPIPIPKLMALGDGAKLLKGIIGGGKAGKAGEVGKGLAERCNSFLPATAVLMADGTTKRIDQVKIGDDVLAADPIDGRTGSHPVTRVIVGDGQKSLIEISIVERKNILSPSFPSKIVATGGHPFFIRGTQAWVNADHLHVGDQLSPFRSLDRVTVSAVRAYGAHARVYNLTVDSAHTYYVVAGTVPVLVHNANGPDWDDWRKLVEKNWDPGDRSKDDGYRAPRGNQAENKQFNDAVREYERQSGRKVSPAERQALHKRIGSQGYDYHQILDEAKDIFGGCG